MRKLLGLVVPLAVAGIMGAAAFGFMAANTVEPHNAGYGSNKVGGYHVWDQYEYTTYDSSGNLSQVWALQFFIAPAPTYEINVHVDGAYAFWYHGFSGNTCSNSPASDGSSSYVFCTFSPYVPLASITSFSVEAQDFP